MAENQNVEGCHSCGKEAYIECAVDTDSPFMRLPGTISITRNASETAGPTACNEKTGFQEVETCEGSESVSWDVVGEQCASDPICSHINRRDCKVFRVHHAPYDGTRFWQFIGRVGSLTGVQYDKNSTVGWGYSLAVQGPELKPSNF